MPSDQLYSPHEPSGLDNVDDILAWAIEEFRNIAAQLAETSSLELRLRGSEPKKPREGMIVAADGVNWDPGAGLGIYAFLGGVWTKL